MFWEERRHPTSKMWRDCLMLVVVVVTLHQTNAEPLLHIPHASVAPGFRPGQELAADVPDGAGNFFAGDQPDVPDQPFNPPPSGGGGETDPFTGTCKRSLDIVLLLDHSGSIRYEKAWPRVQAFANKVIDHVTVDPKDGARFSVVTFDNGATLRFGLDRYTDSKSIQAAINAIPRPGERYNTSMKAALDLVGSALSNGRRDTRFIVILISDGLPKDASPQQIINLGRRIKRGDFTGGRSVEFFTVGVLPTPIAERRAMRNLLESLASNESFYHSVTNFTRLGSVLTALVGDTCPYDTTVPGTGQVCAASSDLTIILDGSGSIKESNPEDNSYDNWELMKTFLRFLVSRLGQIGPDNTQVAIIVFANRAKVITYLNQDNSLDELLAVINGLQHKDGNTNTSAGIRAMIDEVLRPDRGDRVGVQNVAVVITDGQSTYNRAQTIPTAQEARNRGVRILAVGITNAVDPAELKGISSPPQLIGVTYWVTPSFQTLSSVLDVTLRQTCRALPDCRRADIAILLDNSGSIEYKGGDNWPLALNFTQNLTRVFSISEDNTRVGLIRFATNPVLEWPLNRYYSNPTLMQAISGLRNRYQGGETEIGKAINQMLNEMFTLANGDRPDVPNIAIIVTDGEDTSLTVRVSEVARRAREAGVQIYVVGITDKVNMTQLRDIASDPDGTHVFQAADYNRLTSILDQVIPNTCGPVPTRPTPAPNPNPSPVTTPSTPTGTGSCRIASDVAFVLDTSGSIREKSFDMAKDFIKGIIGKLDIENPTGSRFAAVTFSDVADIAIPLGRQMTLTRARQAIDVLPFKQGGTNTAAALRLLYEQVFTASGGDRPTSPNIAVIITDGGSSRRMKARTYAEAIEAKKRGIHIIVIGIGRWLDRSELTAIASYPSEKNVIEIQDYSDLPNFMSPLVSFLCNSVNECRSNPCFNGGSCADGIGIYSCFCAPNYGGVNCEYFCREPTDLVFSLDASGSITEENFYRLLNFSKGLVQELSVGAGTSVGLQTFSDGVTNYFNLNDYSTKNQYLDGMTLPYFFNGRTNTAAALRNLIENQFTTQNGDRPNFANVVIMFTDGRSNDRAATWQQALALRRSGVHVITVGLGRSVWVPELRDMASFVTDRNVFVVDSFQNLDSIRASLVETVCNRVDECSSSPCQNGGTCRDGRGGYICECTNSFTGVHCERACSGEMDLVLVTDISGSIRRLTFEKIQEEMVKIIENLEVTADKTRVGAIKFDDNVTIEFPLGLYNNRVDIIQALRFIKYRGGRTNIAGALRVLWEQMFSRDLGARGREVPKVAILFTDGTQTTGRLDLVEESVRAKLQGIHIITVSVGTDVNMDAVRVMASHPHSRNVFRARLLSELPEVVSRVPRATCNDVNECSSAVCDNGGRCKDGLGTYQCECQRGYTGLNCERVCNTRKDIAFLIDIADGRSGVDPLRRAFIRAFLSGLDLESGQVRISTAVYGSRTRILYELDTHDSGQEAIIATTYTKDKTYTNTVEALQTTRASIFTSQAGDRRDAPNVVVILTDGGERNRAGAAQAAQRLTSEGVMIYVVAFGSHTNMAEVSRLVSRPSELVQFFDEARAGDAADELLRSLCSS